MFRDSQNSVISPSCPSQLCLLVIFPWLLPLLLVLCHDPQPRQLLWLEEPEISLRLCSMEWNVWLYCQSDSRHRAMSPSSVSMPTTSTRRPHSPTATGFSRTTAMPPWLSHPRNVMYLDTQERPSRSKHLERVGGL